VAVVAVAPSTPSRAFSDPGIAFFEIERDDFGIAVHERDPGQVVGYDRKAVEMLGEWLPRAPAADGIAALYSRWRTPSNTSTCRSTLSFSFLPRCSSAPDPLSRAPSHLERRPVTEVAAASSRLQERRYRAASMK
jgi:hypothetical protein